MQKAFTLIELLIVIAIMSILASIILVSLNSAKNKSQIVVAKSDMNQLSKVFQMAQLTTGKPLLQITGTSCSDCTQCRTSGLDLRTILDSDPCYIRLITSLTAIENASESTVGSIQALARDPWGSPYLLDENEMEGGNCANKDSLRTAGHDGILNTSDDYTIRIPFIVCG